MTRLSFIKRLFALIIAPFVPAKAVINKIEEISDLPVGNTFTDYWEMVRNEDGSFSYKMKRTFDLYKIPQGQYNCRHDIDWVNTCGENFPCDDFIE